jgi:hypothetical protein
MALIYSSLHGKAARKLRTSCALKKAVATSFHILSRSFTVGLLFALYDVSAFKYTGKMLHVTVAI